VGIEMGGECEGHNDAAWETSTRPAHPTSVCLCGDAWATDGGVDAARFERVGGGSAVSRAQL